MKSHWSDRVVGVMSPIWQLRRMRDRAAVEIIRRHYEAASPGRRTQGWRRSAGDSNTVIGPALAILRENVRDLVRNNPYAESALCTIADHTVGWGIVAKPVQKNQRLLDLWKRWSETTACDADGRHDFFGLQKLVMRTVVEAGECIVRRRMRRLEDGLEVPMQLQVLEPDFIDTSRDSSSFSNAFRSGNRVIQGVEFDGIGRRSAYWLFKEHPGSNLPGSSESVPVPASNVQHIFKGTRSGQVRAPSWFAPVILKSKDFDEFEDATLMKQKIAACLAAFITDPTGDNTGLGVVDTTQSPELDGLGPGALINLTPGRNVEIVQPPQARDYEPYAKNVLRAIATGLGVTYEDLTGDYAGMPFSAARMSRLRHEARVHDWRWRIIIPQFCDPAWRWFIQTAAIAGFVESIDVTAKWTPPPLPMVDPANEGLAERRNIRTGLKTWAEAVRERGYDPDDLLDEIAEFNAKMDAMGIVFDSDPRKMTDAGQAQQVQEEPEEDEVEEPLLPTPDNDDEEEDEEERLVALAGRR